MLSRGAAAVATMPVMRPGISQAYTVQTANEIIVLS